MSDLGNEVFLDIETGGSKKKVVECTAVTSTPLPQFSGVFRGLAFYGKSVVRSDECFRS